MVSCLSQAASGLWPDLRPVCLQRDALRWSPVALLDCSSNLRSIRRPVANVHRVHQENKWNCWVMTRLGSVMSAAECAGLVWTSCVSGRFPAANCASWMLWLVESARVCSSVNVKPEETTGDCADSQQQPCSRRLSCRPRPWFFCSVLVQVHRASY